MPMEYVVVWVCILVGIVCTTIGLLIRDRHKVRVKQD